MAWTPLANRINTLPRVLCGPILRKVTATSATVWLALRESATVTLTVSDGKDPKRLEGSDKTIALGTKLHIVAVTARLPSGKKALEEGVVYQYDLTFAFADGDVETLAAATANALLAYHPHPLPSFCLPPADVNGLRLVAGSCRKPHGPSFDALPMLDDLIEQAAANPLARPHQLLLSGDQIYADDVGVSLLVMLTDAAHTLLGWDETLPFPEKHGGRAPASRQPPFVRRKVLKEVGVTSVDFDAHLLSLGEYLCMYLFVWSDVLWDPIPQFDELVTTVHGAVDARTFAAFEKRAKKKRDAIFRENLSLIGFRGKLGDVRRALANIPTFMIFDDHEITDDWNMTLDICLGLARQPLGQQIVQNGLVAYALCQHWGNAPEQFDDAGDPGRALLDLLDKGTADDYERNRSDIRRLVGSQEHGSIKAKKAVFHDAHSLTYNFTVEGAGHQVVFTDTRTWRFFPDGADEAPELLPKEQIRQQITLTPDTKDRALLVVVSTNAPPIPSIRSATRMAYISNRARRFPDVYEAWEIPSSAFDRLIKAISEKLPETGGGNRGRAILLSGDVHMSFASRLLFTGTSRFDDAPGTSHTVIAVFAQLVASSLKNQDGNTVGYHRHGYAWAPHVLDLLIPMDLPEHFAGWNLQSGTTLTIGEVTEFRRVGDAQLATPIKGPFTITRSGTTQLARWSKKGEHTLISLSQLPQWNYRLEYISPKTEAPLPLKLNPVPGVPATATAAERKKAAAAFHAATGNYRIYDKSRAAKRHIVGVNSLAEITFDWGAGDRKRVNHTLRWRRENTAPVFTTYTVSLDPTDPPVPA
jgi:hypothetical protein